MKILAFMQNMWARDPQRIKNNIAKVPFGLRDQHRLRLIKYCLFSGCKSGRVLKKVFGPLCYEIIWEEASPEIAGDSKAICLPCQRHIQCALDHHNPDVVITFGKIAGDALAALWPAEILVRAPHPAARQPDNLHKLNQAFTELNRLLLVVKG